MSNDTNALHRETLMTMDRRRFMTLLSAAAAAYPLSSLAKPAEQPALDASLQNDPWLTLGAVQQHLFPDADDTPGAKRINALPYLHTRMNTPDADPDQVSFIRQGVGWLNDIAGKQKNARFVTLDENDREQVLRSIEQSRAGERWLSTLLTYVMEALLSDPVYGGNPDGVGWKWLEHQPGYPTPSPDKMYFKLTGKHADRNLYRNTRA